MDEDLMREGDTGEAILPVPHADRDGSERELLRYLAAEYEASADDMAEWAETSIGLAVAVADRDGSEERYPDAIGSLVNAAKAEGKAQRTIAQLRDQRAEWMRVARDRTAERDLAEAALARVEATVEALDLLRTGGTIPHGIGMGWRGGVEIATANLHEALRGPEVTDE